MATSRAVRPQLLEDDDLLARFRLGDRASYAELWRRHARSGITAARSFTGVSDAEDVVAEAFTRIYQAAQSGVGPIGAFRPYLYATIRNVAIQNATRGDRITDVDLDTIPAIEVDPEAALDNSLISSAFRSLPERWQTVLWYLEVEKLSTREAGELLGIKANAVAALAFRARDALRGAWLQSHVGDTRFSGEHKATVALLGDYSRGAATSREQKKVSEHLANCDSCSRISSEVTDAAGRIAVALLVSILGGAAAATYANTANSGALTAANAALPPIPDFGSFTGSQSALASTTASASGTTTTAAGATATATGSNFILVGLITGSLVIAGAAATAVTLAMQPEANIQATSSAQPIHPTGGPTSVAAPIDAGAPPTDQILPPFILRTGKGAPPKYQPAEHEMATFPRAAAKDPSPAPPTTLEPPLPITATPLITGPSNDDSWSPLPAITVTGTGEPGDTITGTSDSIPNSSSLRVDILGNSQLASTVLASSIVVAPDGVWRWTSVPLPDGRYIFRFYQQALGNAPSPAATREVTVDTISPLAPVVFNTWSDSDLIAPSLTGTAEPRSIVTVSDSMGAALKGVVADFQGNWHIDTIPGLTPATSSLRLNQTDRAGHRSPETTAGPFAFIPSVTSPSRIFLGIPLRFTVSGWPNAEILVNFSGSEVGSFVLDDHGKMELVFDSGSALTKGTQTYFLHYRGQPASATLTAIVP